MEAQETKQSLSEVGKQYLAQLEREGKRYFDEEDEKMKNFNKRLKELYDKEKKTE